MLTREVELYNAGPQCVESVRRTIQALPGGGDLIEIDGRYFLTGPNVAFLAFACEQQGYVKCVLPTSK